METNEAEAERERENAEAMAFYKEQEPEVQALIFEDAKNQYPSFARHSFDVTKDCCKPALVEAVKRYQNSCQEAPREPERMEQVSRKVEMPRLSSPGRIKRRA